MMQKASGVTSGGSSDHVGARLLLIGARLLMACASLGVLKVAARGMDDWELRSKAYFTHDISSWLPWAVISVMAGVLFGLACLLPWRWRFRPGVLVVGLLPLVGLVNHIAYFSWSWWPSLPFLFELFSTGILFGFILGVAVACSVAGSREAHPPSPAE